MHANDQTEIMSAVAGDIVALVGLKETTTGETLCDREDGVSRTCRQSCCRAEKKGRSTENVRSSHSSAAEDPSFWFFRDKETVQTVIEGMGELLLEIIVDRMDREFGVQCNVGKPQVSYRKAITARSEVDYTHKKQSGGSGQFARVKIIFEPKEPSDEEGAMDFEFVSDIKGGAIPKEYIPGVQKGIE